MRTYPEILPVRENGGLIEVGVGGGASWRPITFGEDEAHRTNAEACPVGCLAWGGEGYLLLASHNGQQGSLWLLSADLEFVGDLAQLALKAADIFPGLVSLATAFVRDLQCRPLYAAGNLWTILRNAGLQTLAPLMDLAQLPSVQVLSESSQISLTTSGGRLDASLAGIARLLLTPSSDRDERSYAWLGLAADKGRILLPAISYPGFIEDVYYLGRWGNSPLYYCGERKSQLLYYLVQRPQLPNLLYFPEDNMLISKDRSRVEVDDVASVMKELNRHLASLAACRPDRMAETPQRVALLTYGVRHVGHVIWDEMSSVDAFLDRRAPTAAPADLYMVPSVTGLDLYAPIESLYPEFAGRIVQAPSEAELAARAMETGVQIVPISGHVVLQSTRRRITEAIAAYGRKQGEQLAKSNAAKRGVTIVFQIRLTNRCPEDSVGVYQRLARTLTADFGPLLIVIDGINGSGEPGRAAGPIFNGAADNSVRLTSGSEELEAELAWAVNFRHALSDSNIQVISCIGRPMMENMWWLSQADFFVAPIGAGLAKLRWALNVPGFVVTSQANNKNYYAIRIFDEETHMEPPFTPLRYSDYDDVIDLPLTPPRGGPILLAWGIPHPDNFQIREENVFPKIAEALAAAVQDKATRQGASSKTAFQQRIIRIFRSLMSIIRKRFF